MEVLKTIGKAWKIPDIRKKIIFTLLMLVVFRIGSNIPVPGINREILDQALTVIQDCLNYSTCSQVVLSVTLQYLL